MIELRNKNFIKIILSKAPLILLFVSVLNDYDFNYLNLKFGVIMHTSRNYIFLFHMNRLIYTIASVSTSRWTLSTATINTIATNLKI